MSDDVARHQVSRLTRGAIFVSAIVFGFALGLLFGGPYPIGIAVIAIVLSSLLWWFASLVEALPQYAADNAGYLLNAMAASFAALAGIAAVDHGWQKVMDIAKPIPVQRTCACTDGGPGRTTSASNSTP